jgi:hypothetical protein
MKKDTSGNRVDTPDITARNERYWTLSEIRLNYHEPEPVRWWLQHMAMMKIEDNRKAGANDFLTKPWFYLIERKTQNLLE